MVHRPKGEERPVADDADVDVAIADILSQVEQGTGDEWFNRVRYAELDGRNLTEAWLAGDHEEGVYQVLALGYERTEAGAEPLEESAGGHGAVAASAGRDRRQRARSALRRCR